jgi:hypothetical protein
MNKLQDPSFPENPESNRRRSVLSTRLKRTRDLLSVRLTRFSTLSWTRPEQYAWVGLIAISLGLHAQQMLLGNPPPITSSTRWYAFAIGVLLVGWWGSYTDVSLLPVPSERRSSWGNVNLGVALRALSLNIMSLFLIFSSGPSVATGVAAWFTSLGLFLYACRTRYDRDSSPQRMESTTSAWVLPRKVEVLIFLTIMSVAVIMRMWRLGDLGPGMHGDEGEAGVEGLGILNGHLVSPFERGWFTQSNVYYWTLAIFMRAFGTGLAGLRSFAVICGLATVVFVYFIARELFGQRCAIVAGAFLSFQTADLIFSRQQFSNDTLPMFLACVAYLLVRGLKTGRHLHFAIAGLASGFALYYYAGGRLVPPTALLFLGYLAVRRRSFLVRYWTQVSVFLVGLFLSSSPFVAYNYVVAPIRVVGYPNDRFVWYHEAELAAQYGVSGWPAILWNQLTRTLSIITYGSDASAMQVPQFPIARPLESVLIVLGVAWALFRWKDTRFALLAIWFFASIVFGGVLTNEAPDLPRIVGVLAVMPLLIAAVLDHFAGQVQSVVDAQRAFDSTRWAGIAAGSAVLAGATAVAGITNWQTYNDTYMNDAGNQIVSVQAQYVHNRGPSYFYYDLGAYFPRVATLYWGHGDNRFLNPSANGEDVTDLATSLPVADNGPTGEQDVVFLVWTFSSSYKNLLHTLRQYYPRGTQAVDHEFLRPGEAPMLVAFTVPHREINVSRALRFRFISGDDSYSHGLDRPSNLGDLHAPARLKYPVRARWDGFLIAPVTGQYAFRVFGPAGSSFTLDHTRIEKLGHGATRSSPSLLLTRGVHSVVISSTLPTRQSQVTLRWSTPRTAPETAFQPVSRQFIWDGYPVHAGTISH